MELYTLSLSLPVAMIEFVSSSYQGFELERSVEVCLSKSLQTTVPVTVTVVPVEAQDNLEQLAFPATGMEQQQCL